MIVTYKNIPKVTFPVFKLEKEQDQQNDASSTDGLLFWNGKVLDDRNMTGETLGMRRLQSPFRELAPLKQCILDHLGLIKSPEAMYIDSAGKIFIYKKTVFSKLKYYKIKRVDRKETYSLLWVQGIDRPFTIPRPPNPVMQWVGLLHLGPLPWFLYEYSETRKKDTRRKI